ncbi:MAG: tRNA guanosine(34) transglycosylase Tgt [Anaerolineae bacterium]|nr:tRNA guanosine(34) transglycosylase Tgt [Anaerolineae bacterium]MDW8070221.1 tRNA guanosine(34) transglycosylase Tgt [Anaerolineae bacterium]
MSAFSFELVKEDARCAARAGIIHTPHGDIPTPVFAPVGTQATVKTMTPRDLRALGATLILSNTYHLYLRPGAELIARLGGLHRFMGWDGPILTDSGGYQVFSLQTLRRVNDEGVVFRSHIDGSTHFFTPEKVIAIQEQLGADIIMPLDECTVPYDYAYNVQALARTHRWAERSLAAKRRSDQALYGIVQGGIFQDLRIQSARFLRALDLPGYAIGGLSVGETKVEMHQVLEWLHPELPRDRPRYLMAVGSPEDIFECVARGIDQFDCVLPTRMARNGAVLTHRGRLNLRNAQYAADPLPIEESCLCYTCTTFSRAYLRHLIMADEITGLYLTTLHNLHFMLDLMRRIRQSILDGTFVEFKTAFLADYRPTANAQDTVQVLPEHPAKDVHHPDEVTSCR